MMFTSPGARRRIEQGISGTIGPCRDSRVMNFCQTIPPE